jgi:hypothetical protein
VGAAPGGVFDDLGLPLGREFLEELAVVGELGVAVVLDPVHGVGERHLAVLVVVAVALAVGGDVGELGGSSGAESAVVEWKPIEQAAAEVFAAVEQAFKGDGAGGGAVVEEDGDAAAFVEIDAVGMGGSTVALGVGSHVGFVGRDEGRVGRSGWWPGSCSGDAADAGALVGREDGELDALGGEEVEDAAVDGGLGEPHAFGFAAEAVLEVGDAPADLGEGVAAAGERHDDVVVDLRDGGAVAAVALRAGLVGVEDHAVGARGALSASQLSRVGPKLKLMRA